MRRLRKFAALSTVGQALVVSAAPVLLIMRVGLRVMPFRMLDRFLARLVALSPAQPPTNLAGADRIVGAVTLAGRYVPRSTCLTEALTLRLFLGLRGYPARIRIGVTRGDDGQVEGHAWVEMDGKILWTRDEDVSRYVPMPIREQPGPTTR